MVKSITKYARTILDVRRIPEYIGRTIAEAISDCPGPVYIEIPKNVMESSVNAEEIKMQRSYVSGSRPCGNSEDIKKALELINSAERPIIVAGGGVWWAKAAHLLIAAQAADLVLFLSTRPNYILNPDTFPETCKIIRVDIRAAELRNLLDVLRCKSLLSSEVLSAPCRISLFLRSSLQRRFLPRKASALCRDFQQVFSADCSRL
uniref:Thiamine pyrophosphate-binding protein n=1 Tax=Geoglobus ahangari TaxID=113653 RepID=A0A7J3TJ69_9EURY